MCWLKEIDCHSTYLPVVLTHTMLPVLKEKKEGSLK